MADEQTREVKVTIINELGLHARAATRFVQTANQYTSEVTVTKDEQEVNGKSIMGVLMLVAAKGSEILIKTSGDDADEAAQALVDLVNDRFGEEK